MAQRKRGRCLRPNLRLANLPKRGAAPWELVARMPPKPCLHYRSSHRPALNDALVYALTPGFILPVSPADVRSGAEYLLSRRTYTGLEPGPRRDEDGAAADAPLEAAKGLSGRARSYKSENAKT